MYSQFEGDVNKTEKGEMELDSLSNMKRRIRRTRTRKGQGHEEQNGLNLRNVPTLNPILIQ